MRVLSIKEHKDGSATVDLEVTATDRETIRTATGIKRLTKQRISRFIKEGLINFVEQQTKKWG